VRAKPASSGEQLTWLMGRQIVDRASDGSAFAIIGGEQQTMFHVRALTPATCDAVYAVASVAHLFIVTSQADLLALMPPDTPGQPPERHAYPLIPVRSAADVCALLKSGFEEWRAEAPAQPGDLHDIDDQTYGLEL
jgi:hypothetical protein